ncbi:MAG: hypothetical protein IPL53_16355 [Ignavibacteria bacterium]|nr:hypothetical protein [Ignavibacteria bacterium]
MILETKLVIETKPFVDTADHTLQFAVSETSNDHNYFDKFELLEIDHPAGYTLTVTSNNDIVLIDLNNVKSPKNAYISEREVGSELAFDSAFGKFVGGEEKEIITAQFASGEFFNSKEKLINEKNKISQYSFIESFPDSIAVIVDPFESDVIPWKTAKREIGYVSVTDTAGIKNAGEIEFTRRQKELLK